MLYLLYSKLTISKYLLVLYLRIYKVLDKLNSLQILTITAIILSLGETIFLSL